VIGFQRERQHGLGPVSCEVVIGLVKGKGQTRSERVNVGEIQHLAGIRNVARDGLVVDRDSECRVNKLFPGQEPLLKRFVLV